MRYVWVCGKCGKEAGESEQVSKCHNTPLIRDHVDVQVIKTPHLSVAFLLTERGFDEDGSPLKGGYDE